MRGFVLAGLLVGCVEPPTLVLDPLHVLNWSPSSGATCVDPHASVAVTFSDRLLLDTLRTPDTLALLDAAGPVTSTLDYDELHNTARLLPAQPLEYGRQYTIQITSELTGAEEGPLPVDLESAFKTVGRVGCTPGARCQLPSDCPANQICTSLGECSDQCVTSRDCPLGGTCQSGSCI